MGVSLHPALGGRALWLVNAATRNAGEPAAAAAIAGVRLQRVLGGFNGIVSLDDRWSAFYVRANEIVIVASFESHLDGAGAQRCAEAARAALVELCGAGKVSEVTLANLGRRGAEVQLALRKCAAGAGRLLGASIGKIDLASQLLSPELPADDRASKDIRASNDITAPAAGSAGEINALRRSDALSEATRSLRLPPAGLPQLPPPVMQGQFSRAHPGQRGALLSLLPRVVRSEASALPISSATAAGQAAESPDDDDSEDEGSVASEDDECEVATVDAVARADILRTAGATDAPVPPACGVQVPSTSSLSVAVPASGMEHRQAASESEGSESDGVPGQYSVDTKPAPSSTPELIGGNDNASLNASEAPSAQLVDPALDAGMLLRGKPERALQTASEASPQATVSTDSTSTTSVIETPDYSLEQPTSAPQGETPTQATIVSPVVDAQTMAAQPVDSARGTAVETAISIAAVADSTQSVGAAANLASARGASADELSASLPQTAVKNVLKILVAQSETLSVHMRLGAGVGGSTIEGTLVLRSAAGSWCAQPAVGALASAEEISALGGVLVELVVDSWAPLTRVELSFADWHGDASESAGTVALHPADPEATLPTPSLPMPAIPDGSAATTERGVLRFALLPAATSAAGDSPSTPFATLHYAVTAAFSCVPVLKAVPTYKLTYAPVPALAPTSSATSELDAMPPTPALKLHQHRCTDVMLRTQLHPALSGRISDAQFLIQLPPLPAAVEATLGGDAEQPASYLQPQFRPAGQWNAQRAQVLWHVHEDVNAGTGAQVTTLPPADDNLAHSSTFLAPGRPAEFKCRVPVAHGSAQSDAAALAAASQWHPLQLKAGLLLHGVAANPLRLSVRDAAKERAGTSVIAEMAPPQSRLQVVLRTH